jgi:hypothetical protein
VSTASAPTANEHEEGSAAVIGWTVCLHLDSAEYQLYVTLYRPLQPALFLDLTIRYKHLKLEVKMKIIFLSEFSLNCWENPVADVS